MLKVERFYLKRKEDISGISGTGIVAVGAILPSGICVVEWQTVYSSINFYKNFAHVQEIHGHDGATEVILGDPPEPKKKRKKKNEDA